MLTKVIQRVKDLAGGNDGTEEIARAWGEEAHEEVDLPVATGVRRPDNGRPHNKQTPQPMQQPRQQEPDHNQYAILAE